MSDRHILYKLQPAIQGEYVTDAQDVELDSGNINGVLASVNDVQTALQRIDNTGVGAAPRTFTGSFFPSYGNLGNQDQWYGGRQSVTMQGARGQSNGNYTYELPDISELNSMFDDQVARGLSETYQITIDYQGGSSSSIIRNSMTIRPPSVSSGFSRNEIPVTIGQGAFVTFRINRVGGTLGTWERVSVGQSTDPVATFGEVALQNVGWNNNNNSFLPPSGSVLKGYAFPVIGSNPNDGTLRQGLIDSGVSEREIYDGDYVIWTADAFTAWTDGGNWFVLNRDSMQRISLEASNFLSQVSEIDNRADLGLANFLGGDAVVWISENPLAEAPFITPSTDPNNPRPGDDYAYIGGREDRNAQSNFQFGQNRFGSFLTVGINPNFIAAHGENDIFVRIRDDEGNIINNFNLATDFVFTDDATFTNSTYRHYKRSTSINYPFLATIEITLTQVQRHFRMNPASVDVTDNIADEGIVEGKLSSDVVEKLNQTPASVNITTPIDPGLTATRTVTHTSVYSGTRFLFSAPTDAYPSSLSGFSQVGGDNPRFTATNTVLFLALEEPDTYALRNITADTIVGLDNGEATVETVESFSVSGITYFVFRITGIVSGNVYEVDRSTAEVVNVVLDNIDGLQQDVARIDAELEHAALNLPDELVHVLENDVSVTEQTNASTTASEYNKSLGSSASQKIFYESNPNSPSNGILASKAINDTSGARARRKMVYIPNDHAYGNAELIFAFDGATTRPLVSFINNQMFAKVFVPAVPAGSTSVTLYPSPSNRVSGAGIWQTIEALTFVNGVPVPEADELFFTRNIPTSATTLTIQYRGHANGNLFGAGSVTLAGVGGGSDAIVNATISDGSETATLEIRWEASNRRIRASITERVHAGLPTINDIQVILSYQETRTVPSTAATTRDVLLESQASTGNDNVIVFKPSSSGNLILVGDVREVDTGYAYTTLFGASETGNLTIASNTAQFLDFENIDPTNTTVLDLENHATLPQFGLFTTNYTEESTVNLGTSLEVQRLNIHNIPTSASGLSSGDIWNNGGVLNIVT